MFASGYASRRCLITPLPTIWLGRHANGWQHTILPAPLCISSIISPVRSHPSPVWFPSDTRSFASAAVSFMDEGASKRLLSASAWLPAFLNHSRIFMTVLLINADFPDVPRYLCLKLAFSAQ